MSVLQRRIGLCGDATRAPPVAGQSGCRTLAWLALAGISPKAVNPPFDIPRTASLYSLSPHSSFDRTPNSSLECNTTVKSGILDRTLKTAIVIKKEIVPPSGYFEKHSKPISMFLLACVEDLIAENKGVRLPEASLQRELRHIKTDLGSTKRNPIPTKVLELTRSFYEELLRKNSTDFNELETHAQELLETIECQIEAIKVADSV